MTVERTDNDVVAELAARAAGKADIILVKTVEGFNVPLLARSDGGGKIAVESIKRHIDEYRTQPERKRGTATLVDLTSFIDHVQRNKDAHSVLFAVPERTSPKLIAVYNYNEPNTISTYDAKKPEGEKVADVPGQPRFGDHRAQYVFPLSDEWKAWDDQDGEHMSQEDFAAFLEERLIDVADPVGALDGAKQFADKLAVSFATPQKLLELSRGLAIRATNRVKQNVKLQSGEAQITFSEEHTDETGQPLTIPGAFLIQVPVFKSGAPYQIPARLRYRVQGGGIQWWFDLYRADLVFDHAFEEACESAVGETSLPLFKGTPEQ